MLISLRFTWLIEFQEKSRSYRGRCGRVEISWRNLIQRYGEGYAWPVRTSETAMRARCVRWKQNTNVPEVRAERVTPPRRCLFPDRLEYVNAVLGR